MSRWPWPEYMEGATDPLAGWEVPEHELNELEIRKVFLSALSKIAQAHTMLVTISDIDEYHLTPDNTPRNRIESKLREARKQLHIALVAMRSKD